VSESKQLIHRAIESYDHAEVEAVVVRLAQSARRDRAPIEQLIVDLKHAVNSLPMGALRDRGRSELRDSIIRIAIAAYYESEQPSAPRFASEQNQSH
jgi:hypothetical protein